MNWAKYFFYKCSQSPLFGGVAYGALALIVSNAINILLHPLLLNKYGVHTYGAWAVINTICTYLALSNLGIPTLLAALAHTPSFTEHKVKLIWNAFFLMLIISVGMALLIWLLGRGNVGGSVSGWLGVSFDVSVYKLFIASIAVVLAKFPVQVLLVSFNVYQKQIPSKIFEMLFFVTTLVAFYMAYCLDLAIYEYTWVIFSMNFLVFAAIFFYFRKTIARVNFLSLSFLEVTYMKKLLSGGSGFLLLSLPVTLGWSIDNLIISKYLSLADVTGFSFTSKLLLIPYGFLNLYSVSLFSIYGYQYAKGEFEWILNSYKKGLDFITLLNGAVLLFFLIFSEEIIRIWTGNTSVVVNGYLTLSLTFYVFSLPLVNQSSALLSGLNKKRENIMLSYVELLIHLFLSITLVKLFGLAGVGFAMAASSLCISFVFLPLVLTRKFKWFSYRAVVVPQKMLFLAFAPVVMSVHLISKYLLPEADIYSKVIIFLIAFVCFLILSLVVCGNGALREIKFLKVKQ